MLRGSLRLIKGLRTSVVSPEREHGEQEFHLYWNIIGPLDHAISYLKRNQKACWAWNRLSESAVCTVIKNFVFIKTRQITLLCTSLLRNNPRPDTDKLT